MPKINYQLLKNLPKKQPKFDCQINGTNDPSLITWLSTAANSMGFNSQIITTEIVSKLFWSLKLWPNNFDCWNCLWWSSNFNCQNNDKWIHFRSPSIEGTNQVKKKVSTSTLINKTIVFESTLTWWPTQNKHVASFLTNLTEVW
jgi:hypothetical protein